MKVQFGNRAMVKAQRGKWAEVNLERRDKCPPSPYILQVHLIMFPE